MNLFLDDKRMPSDVFIEKLWDNDHGIYVEHEWEVVETVDEFIKWIKTNGLPRMVSFDHDLATSHYTPQRYWNDYEKSKEWQEAQVHTEKTGADAAEWLLNYCVERKLNLPLWSVHSANPVGRDKIISVLMGKIKKWQ